MKRKKWPNRYLQTFVLKSSHFRRGQLQKYAHRIPFTHKQLLEDLSKEVEILRTEKMRALTALHNCREVPSQTETELQIQLDSLKQDHRSK